MIVFRTPFSDRFYTVSGEASGNAVEFVSFDEQSKVSFPGKIVEISEEELLRNEFFSSSIGEDQYETEAESEQQYLEKITDVIGFIRKEKLKKLVISRRKIVPYQDLSDSGEISMTKSFLNLCGRYPNALVYLFQKESVWMGAFSELLGRFNKINSTFETMSLAGTLPVEETWTEKEIEEQKPVTDYISGILKNYSDEVEQSSTTDHISGNIKHLRTDFRATVDRKNLENLIADLHPTPAVCGIPKDFCRKAIQEFENYDRRLYAGYIRVETETDIQYFVNLRCAEFTGKKAVLYVGGGITAQSDPAKEWRETELKSQAILNSLVTS